MTEYGNTRFSIPSPGVDDDAGSAYQLVAENRVNAELLNRARLRLKQKTSTQEAVQQKPSETPADAKTPSDSPDVAAKPAEANGGAKPPEDGGVGALTMAGAKAGDVPAAISGGSNPDVVDSRAAIENMLTVGEDIGKGMTELPAQLVGGVIDALGEMDQTMQELIPIGGAQLFNAAGEFDPSLISNESMVAQEKANTDLFSLLTTDKAESVSGGFARATAQFLTGFIPAGRAVSGLQAIKGGTVLAATAAGAIADMVVFDPEGDRLSTFLNEVPVLGAIVPDYLADNSPDQSHWEGRIKNAIEGIGLGLATDGLLAAFKYYKANRRAKADAGVPDPVGAGVEAAKDALKASAREEIVQEIPDEALHGLGSQDAPLIVHAAENETATQAFNRLDAARIRVAKADKDLASLDQINSIRQKFAAKTGVVDRDPMDEMLDTLRSNAPINAKIPKRPAADIVKSLGGVDPTSSLAGDLRSRGITPKAFPGLFKSGGRKTLDNIPASEHDLFNYRNLSGDDGYIPQQSFIDALESELKGEPWMTAEHQKAYDDLISPIDDLEEHLDRLGIDYKKMGNQAIKDRLQQITDEAAIASRDTGEDALFSSKRTMEDMNAEDALRPADPEVPAKGKVYVNLARINSADDVRAALQATLDMDAKNIAEKTRGVVSNEQTIKESSQEYRDINDLIGRPPGPMNAAQATAARRLLASSTEQVLQLAKLAERPEATPADLYNFRRAMSVQYAIQSEVVAARTETARALQSWSIPMGSSKARSQAVAELIAQGGGAGDLQQMAKAVASMGDNPTGINTIARELGRGRFGKALYQVWINGLLSSPKTHMANILSNSITAMWSVPERYMAAGFSKAFYAGEIEAGEATALAFGMVKGFRDGARLVFLGKKAAGKADLTDVYDSFVKAEGVQPNAISAEAFGLDPAGGFGWGIDMLSKFVNAPGSALGKEDQFFKTIGYRMELQAQAYRIAASEGLEGKAFAERVADVLNNPPDNIRAEAIDAATYQTFTNALSPSARQILGGINKNPVIGPVFRFVVPFVKTPTNILKWAFKRTPLAYMAGSVQADIKAGGARAAQAHARVALGSMTMLTIMDMTTEGTITGRGPQDPQQRALWLKNNQPYSIKFNDRWYSYSRMDPVGMIVGFGADMTEIMSNVHQDDSEQLAAAGIIALANNMASKTYMNGIYDFIAAADPNNPMSNFGKYLSDQAGGIVPYSSFLRNLNNATDPNMRETKTTTYGADDEIDPVATYLDNLVNKLRAGIPGQSDQLPLKRDLWGEPITKASGIGWGWDLVSPIASRADDPDPVTQVMIDNKIEVSFPSRIIDGVQLTNAEYTEFQELAGKPAKEMLDEMINDPSFQMASNGPDGMKAEMIKDVINMFRERAKQEMRATHEDLRDRAYNVQNKKLQTLTGN